MYRLRGDGLPKFDDSRPLTTDMDATLEYLATAQGPVAVTKAPFCAWLARGGRVFCSSGLDSFMADHFRQLQLAQQLSGKRLNWTRAKSVFLLSYLRNALTFTGWRSAPAVVRRALQHAAAVPGRVNPLDIASLLVQRFALGKSLVHLG
jgi:hypothetical protein